MTLPIARETETCNVQRPECSAFLPLSINSSIPSNDCKEVLACESQDASSPLDEDMSSSDSMHNAHNRPVCSSSSAFLPPNIDSNIPSSDYEEVLVCESQDASSPLVEDMRSSDSMHNAHDRPGCSSSSAFLQPSIDSNIPSSDYEELLVCESQVTSSQIVEDTGSSNIGMENDREEAPEPSGLNSAANHDSDPEIKYLFTINHLRTGKALPIRPASNQPFSTIENEFLRPYRGFKRDISQAIHFCPCSLALTRYVLGPAETNIVTRECKIHNDASVDISQDNEKLVAIVLDHENHQYKIAVHSLLPHNLGQLLCIYDPCPNPVSVSISPLSQFIFIGMSAARGAASNFAFPDAEIISIFENPLCRAEKQPLDSALQLTKGLSLSVCLRPKEAKNPVDVKSRVRKQRLQTKSYCSNCMHAIVHQKKWNMYNFPSITR
ncbi:hypothetical protein TNCV_1080121 [Trichonephila clavipes]|nr:hypothetical protein TNCV_1080121 [Trichonephila clavipes]